MRSPVFLGALMALAVGVLGLAGLLALIGSRTPIIAPSPSNPVGGPGSSLGLYSPSPSPQPSQTPTPTPAAGSTTPIGTAVGQRAPRLVLPHLAGGDIDTANAAGTPLWINFMATWCPPCRDELPMMQHYTLQLGDEVEIILVNVAEDEDTVLSFLLELDVDLPVALDTDRTAQTEWGAFALPVHYFIDADGMVREVVYGGAPPEIFLAALEQIAPESNIRPPPTDGP